MTFDEFVPRILEAVQDIEGEDKEIEVRSITKNNGLRQTAMMIRDVVTDEMQQRSSPVLDLGPYYEKAQEGVPIRHLARMLCETASEFQTLPKGVDAHMFEDGHKIRENVFCKLVNTEQNTELLSHCPHEPWQDLAVIYYCEVGDGTDFSDTVTMTNQIMELAGLTEEELRDHAWKNTEEKKKVVFQPLGDVLSGITGSMDVTEEGIEESPLYMLSTEGAHLGAIAAALPDACRMAADHFGGSFFMIPSSIHEFLLLADNGYWDAKELNFLVQAVNAAEVAPGDVLSNHAYYCDGKDLSIHPAAEYKEQMEKSRQMQHASEKVVPFPAM